MHELTSEFDCVYQYSNKNTHISPECVISHSYSQTFSLFAYLRKLIDFHLLIFFLNFDV